MTNLAHRAQRSPGQNAVLGLGGTSHGAGLASATPSPLSSANRLRVEVIRGVDEEAENPVVPDMTTSDTVLGVVVVEANQGNEYIGGFSNTPALASPQGASSDLSLVKVHHRNIGDFVAGTGVMTSTANKEDNTGNVYIVTWSDVAYAATEFVPDGF